MVYDEDAMTDDLTMVAALFMANGHCSSLCFEAGLSALVMIALLLPLPYKHDTLDG
jgi:hypothetical protein